MEGQAPRGNVWGQWGEEGADGKSRRQEGGRIPGIVAHNPAVGLFQRDTCVIRTKETKKREDGKSLSMISGEGLRKKRAQHRKIRGSQHHRLKEGVKQGNHARKGQERSQSAQQQGKVINGQGGHRQQQLVKKALENLRGGEKEKSDQAD